jgi:hypothetical protein
VGCCWFVGFDRRRGKLDLHIFFGKVVSTKRLVKNKEIIGEDGNSWYLYG